MKKQDYLVFNVIRSVEVVVIAGATAVVVIGVDRAMAVVIAVATKTVIATEDATKGKGFAQSMFTPTRILLMKLI